MSKSSPLQGRSADAAERWAQAKQDSMTEQPSQQLSVIDREEWGARDPNFSALVPGTLLNHAEPEGRYDPSTNPGGYAPYSELKPGESLDSILDTVVIHHSGDAVVGSLVSDAPPTVKDVQVQHMFVEAYADIAYHYAIDAEGNVFEGRPIDVRGHHVAGANTGKIGIVLLGDFEPGPRWDRDNLDDLPPPQAQVDSAKILISQLDDRYGIEEVLPHTDVVEGTECPGDGVLPLIPEFNDLV